MKKNFVLGIFEDEEVLVHAAEKVVHENIDIYDIYTPFPVHGLDDLLKIERSFLPYVTFLGGLLGCSFAFLAQSWIMAVDWPINIGGKDFWSIPAFIPVTFELTVLFGALITVKAFFFACKLYPGKKAVLLDKHQTSHSFVMAIENNSGIDLDAVKKILEDNGAKEIRLHAEN